MSGIDIVVPSGRAEQWERRHEAGEVPGRWPYGLHHLGDAAGARDVRLRALPESGRVRRLTSRVLPPPSGSSRRVALGWDENVAARMVASRDYATMHCGVIWATDRWARAREDVPPLTRRTLARMTSVWTLSRPQVDHFDGLLPASVRRSFVKFGVDSEFYALAPYPERPTVFSVGGDRDRDSETLLEAYRKVLAARPGTRAVLQTPRDVAVPDGVEVVAHLPHVDLRAMYAAASVVAIATRPNLHVSGMTVSLEAQSVGRPVVLTRTPGTEDYVSDGDTGHLTPVGDAGQLADRIIDLLDDPDSAAATGLRGRAMVEADLTDRHLADRLLEAVDG